MRARPLRLLCCAVAGFLLCAGAEGALVPFENVKGQYQTLLSGGKTRNALYLMPRTVADPNAKQPLFIVLHYLDGEPESMANFTVPGFLVRDFGIYVVLPEGVNGDWTINPGNKVGPDDVAYITQLIDDAVARYPIDPKRVYIAGYSNGGYMAERYICEHPEKIAAGGVVAATMRKAEDRVCTSTTPTPMVFYNGTEDGAARYDGKNSATSSPVLGTDNLGAVANAERWAKVNGCTLAPTMENLPDTINDGTTVTVAHYDHCTSSDPVDFYTLVGGGHTWPGAIDALPALGPTSQDVSATVTMWAFFSRFARP